MEPMRFDLVKEEIPVTIGPKDYLLVEATAGAAKQWKNASTSRLIFGPDGKPQSLKDVGDLEPMLVALCLWDVDSKGKRTRVPISTVESWPSRIVTALFEKAKSISDLSEGENPLHVAFRKALQLATSPVEYSKFKDWVDTLQEEEYEPLKELVKVSIEDKVKNASSDMEFGSS